MACKLDLKNAANRLSHIAGARFPYPDATRASTPAGRRAVADWTMNVVTSDAALHQMRMDVAHNGTEIKATENFMDAFGNVGNMVGDAQNREHNEYISPLVKALEKAADSLQIKGMAARKQLAVDIGHYREALHAVERQARFANIKGEFIGYNSPIDSPERARAAEAADARKKLNKAFDKGEMSPTEYDNALRAIVQQFPIDPTTATDLGGMELEVADQVIKAMRARSGVVEAYGMVKPYIDRAFGRALDIYEKNGKVDEGTRRYHELYGFAHYAPVYSADQHDNLNMSNFMDNISPGVLNIAEGGIPGERIPFFPALMIQLNAAAKFSAENEAAIKLWSFAKAHGKDYGMTVGGGKRVYGVSDSGHEVRAAAVPPNSIPVFMEGKLYFVTVNGTNNKANRQLFASIKNRLTNQFAVHDNPVNRAVRGVITQAPARLFTTLNVNYWLNSMIRDPLSTLVNVALDTRIKNKRRVLARAAGYMVGDFRHSKALQYFLRDPEHRKGATLADIDGGFVAANELTGVDSEFATWANDLARHGGETIFNRSFYTADYQGVAEGNSLDVAVPFNLGGTVDGVHGTAVAAAAAGTKVMHTLGNVVSAFDMQSRVAVYRALVEGGHSKTEAAAMVREFMDFSQKPLSPSVFSDLVPFFRTSMVGAYRAWELMMYNNVTGEFSPKYTALAAMVAMGYMAALAAKGDNDDDGMPKGDKIAHSKAFSSVVLGFDADGNARSLPLPYGPAAIFVGMGAALERMKSGLHDRDDVLAAFGAHVIRNMTPLSMSAPGVGDDTGSSMGRAIINANPVVGTVATLVTGEDGTGRELYASDKASGTEDWSSAKLGTEQTWIDMAHFLYENTGGTVDARPESIEFLLKQWTPFGIGRMAADEVAKAHRRNMGSPDANDYAPAWENVVGSVFLDKSPNFYWYNQYKKAEALYMDLERRKQQGIDLSPTQQEYYDRMALRKAWIGHINGTMNGMSEEEKFAALQARRQNERAMAVEARDLQRAASFDLLAED